MQRKCIRAGWLVGLGTLVIAAGGMAGPPEGKKPSKSAEIKRLKKELGDAKKQLRTAKARLKERDRTILSLREAIDKLGVEVVRPLRKQVYTLEKLRQGDGLEVFRGLIEDRSEWSGRILRREDTAAGVEFVLANEIGDVPAEMTAKLRSGEGLDRLTVGRTVLLSGQIRGFRLVDEWLRGPKLYVGLSDCVVREK